MEPAVVRRQALRRAVLRLGVAAGGGFAARHGAALLPGLPGGRRGAAAAQPADGRRARACFTRCSASRGSSSPGTRRSGSGRRSSPTCSRGSTCRCSTYIARYRATPSRVEKTRLLYLVVGGFLTVTSALLEALPHGPNFGNVFIIVYLYFLSQNLVRYRLLDLNEVLGRMSVLGTLVFILAFIYGVLVSWVRSGRAGAVLLQHAARVGGDRHPDRAAARAHRGGDQPLDVPGEVRAQPAHRDAARRAGQRHRHARAGAARAGGAGGFAAHHARVDLPGRPRRLGVRAGGAHRAAARGALRRDHAPRVLRAAAAHGRHHAGGDRARGGGAPHGLDRGAGEPGADVAVARADERLGGAGVLERGPAAGRAGDPRRAPARGVFVRRDRAVSRRRRPASASRCSTRRCTSG